MRSLFKRAARAAVGWLVRVASRAVKPFDARDGFVFAGLVFLGAGLTMIAGLGWALAAVGGVLLFIGR